MSDEHGHLLGHADGGRDRGPVRRVLSPRPQRTGPGRHPHHGHPHAERHRPEGLLGRGEGQSITRPTLHSSLHYCYFSLRSSTIHSRSKVGQVIQGLLPFLLWHSI